MSEMARLAGDIARDPDEDSRTRAGAAQVTASILAKMVPALTVRRSIIEAERKAAAFHLDRHTDDPFQPIRRIEASRTLIREQRKAEADD